MVDTKENNRAVLRVDYHGITVGALSYSNKNKLGSFQYDEKFISSGLELSPIKMPLSSTIYSFTGIDRDTFKGLPGMLADSLPDDFGNAVLNEWIAMQGDNRTTDDITPLERLQYTGSRGMGALTYHPATPVQQLAANKAIKIDSLVEVTQNILDKRSDFSLDLKTGMQVDNEGMLALLSVGMSAGGARPKAVLAFNKDFTQVRSGQAKIPTGFEHYLMKFDGVTEHNKNKETFGDPMGFGAMEYTYYQMATNSGINMTHCHLLEEGPRRHFITKRFDRNGNDRVHVQTVNALAHVSYKQPGTYSYAELFNLAKTLRVSKDDAKELFRRMVLNVVTRNHDDHSKNFAFMMDEKGNWSLAPAYDIAYSYKKGSHWVNSHWMILNGKRDNFTRSDFHAFMKISPVFTESFINSTLDKTIAEVSRWREMALKNDVPVSLIDDFEPNLRLNL